MKRTRTLNPWGYREEIAYQSEAEMFDTAFDKMYASVYYDSGDTKIHFLNVEGEERATLDVTDFNNQGKIISDVIYDNGNIIIIFNDGCTISVNITEVTADVERRVTILEEEVAEMSGSTEDLKDELDEEKARALSSETAMKEDIATLQEQAFTSASYGYDAATDSIGLTFYNQSSDKRDTIDLFNTDDGATAIMSAGTF